MEQVCPACHRPTQTKTNQDRVEVWAYHDRHPLLKALCKASKKPVAEFPPERPTEGTTSMTDATDVTSEDDGGVNPTVDKLRAAAAKVRLIADAPPEGWFEKGDPDLRSALASRYSHEALPVRSVAPHIEFASPALLLLVASWLDAEASALGSFPVFVDLLNATIRQEDYGEVAHLKLGVKEDGTLKALVESTPAALRLAEEILRW